jgi:hypothetical protein
MSRSLWRCRNRECPVPHGAVLGRVTREGGLVLAAEVVAFKAYLDSKRIVVRCPHCGVAKEVRGAAVFSSVHLDNDLRPA